MLWYINIKVLDRNKKEKWNISNLKLTKFIFYIKIKHNENDYKI